MEMNSRVVFLSIFGFIWIFILIAILYYVLSSLFLMKIAKKLQVNSPWFAWIHGLREWLIKEMAGASTLSFIVLIISEWFWAPLLIGGRSEELAGVPSSTILIIRIMGIGFLVIMTAIFANYWVRITKKLNKKMVVAILASPIVFTVGIVLLTVLAFIAKSSGMLGGGKLSTPITRLAFGSLFCSIFLFPFLHLVALWLLSREEPSKVFLPPPKPSSSYLAPPKPKISQNLFMQNF